jgi:serine/threonine protein kinase/tetratricopeptide (TPR) repeat protein
MIAMQEESIFIEALAKADPAERAAFLDRACAGDEALRRRIERLLARHGQPDSFLEAPATEAGVTVDDPAADRPGLVIGAYKLLQPIGEGGMGTVYMAEQTRPVKRLVALKVIKPGMDSRQVLARFEAERQALALMDHPNIAHVYDGGTTEAGQPFFVMELVRGEPITTYCDRKRLPVQARLELFVSVCQAVQHAHQKGIIHRDLKPSNVMVTEVDGRPSPKVIDFGVAKATEFNLTDQSLGDTGAIVGTPTYMSPEQADPSSMDIDTRTDVYALGVILYELLAGTPPLDAKQFKRGAILEMLRMVREVEPPKPSTKVSTSQDLPNIAATRDVEPAQLKRALRGDLDWIAMKALEKDRTRRYETANGFAADILRHLAHEPVVAAPPSSIYRLRKFVRKHRGAVIAASLLILSLLGGLGAVLEVQRRHNRVLTSKNTDLDEANRHLREAIQQKDAANTALGEANTALGEANNRVQARFDLAREAIRSFKAGVEEEETLKENRLRPLRDKLLGSARRFYDKLSDLLKGQPDAGSKAVLAESYAELGELIDRIGQRPEALEAYKKAVAIRRELAAVPGASAADRLKLAETLIGLGDESDQLDDQAGALAAHTEAVALAEPMAAGAEAPIGAARALASAHNRAGVVLSKTGKFAEALAALRRAREVGEVIVREPAAVPDDRMQLAEVYNGIGILLMMSGDLPGALVEQRKYQALMRGLAAEHPKVANYRLGAATSHNQVAMLLEKSGDLPGALVEHRKSQELFRALAAEHPEVPDNRFSEAVSQSFVGILLEKTGDMPGALVEHQQAQELFRALAAERPEVPLYRRNLAASHSRVGIVLEQTGDLAGALAEQRTHQQMLRALAAEQPEVSVYRRMLAVSHNRIGNLLTLAGKAAEALTELDQARSLLEALAQAEPQVADNREMLAVALYYAGDALRDLGRMGEARDRYAGGVALADALAVDQPMVPVYRTRLADSLRRRAWLKLDAGDAAGANADARRAVTLFDGLPTREGSEWFSLACARATLSDAGRDRATASAATTSALADQAMNDLRQAARASYRNVTAYRHEPALAPLRGRDDFQVLMMDLAMPANPFAGALPGRESDVSSGFLGAQPRPMRRGE